MRWMTAVVGVVVAIVGVAALAVVVARHSSGRSVAELELGDCFDLPTMSPNADTTTVEIVMRVELIDCDDPHGAQVVQVGELNPRTDRGYPSDAVLFDEADQQCLRALSIVGDRFGLLPVAPTEATWEALLGRYQCLAVPFGGGRSSGTLMPAGRSG